jgi:hypothetical protein
VIVIGLLAAQGGQAAGFVLAHIRVRWINAVDVAVERGDDQLRADSGHGGRAGKPLSAVAATLAAAVAVTALQIFRLVVCTASCSMRIPPVP